MRILLGPVRCLLGLMALGAFLSFNTLLQGETAPGSALEFDGVDARLEVPHSFELQTLPLTITAWIRTTQNDAPYRAVVSKYAEGSNQGYAVAIRQGRVEAWYYINGSRHVWVGEAGSAAGFVADGAWHHVAFVVGSSSASIYLDGQFSSSRNWVGASGSIPDTVVTPLQLGNYPGPNPHFFKGRIDEVTLWKRELSPNELNHLKHRHLLGGPARLDGLIAYYPLDESGGPTASDASGGGHDATYFGAPGPVAWPSTAPVILDPVAQTALSLDGVTGSMRVAHDAALNSFPMTVTAWVRTTDFSARVQGVVSKYNDGSFNGFSLFVYGGRIRAFYIKDGVNYIWAPAGGGSDGLGVLGGFVADGNWHHVSFVVSATGGELYVDGAFSASLPWGPFTFSKGAHTSPANLLLGLYSGSPYSPLNGAIDEVAFYNVALTQKQIAERMNLSLSGAESGLVSYWKLDEGATDAAASQSVDSSGNGHTADGVGAVSWSGSAAGLGDGQVHVAVDYTTAYDRLYAVQSSTTGLDAFTLKLKSTVWRFYDYGYSVGAPPLATINLQGSPQIRDATTGLLMDLDPASGTWSARFALGADPVLYGSTPTGVKQTTLSVRVKPGSQLDSVDNYYSFGSSLVYGVDADPSTTLTLEELPITQVIHCNGKLFFSSLETAFTELASSPPRGGPLSGGIETELVVPKDNGFLPGKSGYHYGDGTPIKVILFPNGDCLDSGSTVALRGPTPDEDQAGHIFFRRSNLVLNDGGVRGFVTLELPPGFSVGISKDLRITTAELEFPNTDLSDTLIPTGPVLSSPGPLLGVSDSFPLWIDVPQLNWEVGVGRIVLPSASAVTPVHQIEDDQLQAALDANLLVNPLEAERKSNDGYFRSASLDTQDVIVAVSDEGSARLDMSLVLAPGSFRPHFPLIKGGPPLQWSDRGTLNIRGSLIDTASSQLLGVDELHVSYQQNCSGDACKSTGAVFAELLFTPDSGRLGFTLDGGLVGNGTLPPSTLAWGYINPSLFAQKASAFTDAAFMMSGTTLRFDQTNQKPEDRPGTLLLTGTGKTGDESWIERPYDGAYPVGDANYAGVNLRVLADGGKQGQSFLGGVNVGPYPLRGRSKYYARYGGVTGIHEAQNLPTGNLRFYGYDAAIDGLLLSYRDSENIESQTDGSVTLPNPAGFTQEFSRLKFLCHGDLDDAQIPSGSPAKGLSYWPTRVTPRTMVFKGDPTAPCGTTDRLLVFGTEIKTANIPETLHALLGFWPDGHLSTVAKNRGSGIDSRFKPSATISYRGPGDSTYRLATSGEAYFNDPLVGEDVNQRNGFLNTVGRTDLPFFEDMWCHVHLKNEGPAGVDVMGGWDEGGKSILTTDKLDPAHKGFPGADLASYRDGNSYRPHARKQWLGIVDFDYPLKWAPAVGTFTSSEETTKKLLVLEVKNRVKKLTPTMADLDFGIDAGIPKISIAKFAHDGIEGLTGAEDALKGALGNAASTQLSKGLNSLNAVMADQANALFTKALQGGMDGPLGDLYDDIKAKYALFPGNPAAFATSVQTATSIRLSSTQLQNALLGQGGFSQAASVVSQVQNALGDAINGLRVVEDLLSPAGRDERFKTLIQSLIGSEAPAFVSQLASGLAKEAFASLLKDVQPSLDTLSAEVKEVRGRLEELRSTVGVGGFPEVNAKLNVQLGQTVNDLALDLSKLITSAELADGRYFQEHTKEQVVAEMRKRLIDAVLGSGVTKIYQTALRERIYDLQARMRTALDGVFQVANQLGVEALSSVLAEADKAFADFLGNNLKEVMAAAKLDGHAHIVGDSLKELSLDADLRLKLPDDFGFHGYLRIRELSSDNTPIGCLKGYDRATEVVMGAKDVNLSWLSPKLRANLDGKFTFKALNGGFEPVGMGGGIGITGQMKFEVFELNELAAALAFGQEENYLAGRVRAKVNRYEFATGFFFGRTCFIDPLSVADPDVGKTLSTKPENFPFTGAYLYGEAWVPLNEALGIVSTCAFNIRGGQGVGSFVFVDGKKKLNVGGKYLYGISGELLCILGVQGEIRAVGGIVFEADPMIVLRGTGKVSAELGYCPFCISWGKEVSMTIRGKSSTLIRGAIGIATNPAAAITTLGDAEYEFDY